MVKVAYGALAVLAVIALVAVPGCRGKGDKEDESGAGEACAACGAGCAEGCTEGCAGCAEGCAEEGCAGCAEGCAGCAEAGTEGGTEGCTGCAEGCAACAGETKPANVSDADARQATRLFESYTRWTRMHREPLVSTQHGDYMIVAFADKRAKPTYRSGEGDYETYAAVAIEGWKDGEKEVVWFMQKRKPGWDRDHSNWWFASVSADGTVREAGKVASCSACHAGAGNDYVYGH